MSFSFTDYAELGELPPRSPLEPVCEDGPFGPVPEEKKRTSRELRELWKKAILQQILLLRMEKENQKLQGWFGVGSRPELMLLVDPVTRDLLLKTTISVSLKATSDGCLSCLFTFLK